MNQTNPPNTSPIFVWNGTSYQKIDCSDILWIERHDGKTRLISKKQHFWLNSSLKNIPDLIPCPNLQQVHRSYIVNTSMIDGFEHRKLFIRQKEIPIGRTFWIQFKEEFSSKIK